MKNTKVRTIDANKTEYLVVGIYNKVRIRDVGSHTYLGNELMRLKLETKFPKESKQAGNCTLHFILCNFIRTETIIRI